jgi:hypothetical protein
MQRNQNQGYQQFNNQQQYWEINKTDFIYDSLQFN